MSLDVNPRTGFRKPGVKIEISKLKGPFADQLAPFEGLWGFQKNKTITTEQYSDLLFDANGQFEIERKHHSIGLYRCTILLG